MGAHHLAVACAMAAMTPHLVEWSAVSEVPFDEWTAREGLMASTLTRMNPVVLARTDPRASG